MEIDKCFLQKLIDIDRESYDRDVKEGLKHFALICDDCIMKEIEVPVLDFDG